MQKRSLGRTLMTKVVIKIKADKRENYALHVCFLLPMLVGIPVRLAV